MTAGVESEVIKYAFNACIEDTMSWLDQLLTSTATRFVGF